MAMPERVIVDGYVPTAIDTTNLRDEAWSFALDQRAFGPRKVWVAFADADGSFRGLAYTDRIDRPELCIGPCIEHLGRVSGAAVAFCDEPVDDGAPPADLGLRFALAREVAKPYGVHLVDWIACDDQHFRSSSLALGTQAGDWWDA